MAVFSGRRAAPIVPLGKTARILLVVITIMSVLGGLAILAGAISMRAAAQMATGLADTATVQITASETLTMAEQEAAALEALKQHPGVSDFRVVSDSESRKLLEPWLGSTGSLEGLEVPRLIAVRFAPDINDYSGSGSIEALASTLSKVPGVNLDTHASARKGLVAMAKTVQALSVFILVLLGIASAAVIVFATRSSIAANLEIVEVLHLIGANDGFVTKQFDRHFFMLGALGGFFGAVIAAVVLNIAAVILPANGAGRILPSLDIGFGDILLLCLLPVLAAIISWASARAAVYRDLSRMV